MHIIGNILTFPRRSSGSCLRSTRLPVGAVGARRRQGDMCATNLLKHLRHPIPHPPQEPPPPRQKHMREWCARFKCFGSCYSTGTDSLFPLNSVLEKIEFVEKRSSRSECRVDTPLAAASLTPGLLKHGKEVDVKTCPCPHLHTSLAHAHASVLQATVKQHGIRLIGELV